MDGLLVWKIVDEAMPVEELDPAGIHYHVHLAFQSIGGNLC